MIDEEALFIYCETQFSERVNRPRAMLVSVGYTLVLWES